MKHRLVFFVCCLLLLGGFNAAAQESTSPLPPPDRGTSPLPAPGEDAPAPSAPSRDNSSGSASSGGSASRSTARTPARQAPARAAPAQPAAASTQEGIPDKGRFWGFKMGGSYDWYSMEDGLKIDGQGKEADGGGFNAGLLFGYDFGLLALQGEILFNTGWNGYGYSGIYGGYSGEEHFGFDMTVLQIPVLLKVDLHWGRIMFQPQAGFYLNFGLGDIKYHHDAWAWYYGSLRNIGDTSTDDYSTSLFGVMIGGAFGVRIGRGYIFLDIRYAGDLSETKLKPEGIEMTRHAVMTSMGYQHYFRSKQ